jgi:hypothetical protein
MIVIVINTWFIAYDVGYLKGGSVGYEIALDTVDKILVANIVCDTCISKLSIVSKYDTNTYIISKKTIR